MSTLSKSIAGEGSSGSDAIAGSTKCFVFCALNAPQISIVSDIRLVTLLIKLTVFLKESLMRLDILVLSGSSGIALAEK
jgi:hypothetical protein